MQTSGNSRGYASRRSSSTTWEDRSLRSSAYASSSPRPAKPVSAPIVQARYRAGMHVLHPSWGEGLVMETRIQDGDETVDVNFKSVGFKRLLASLANLQIL